MTAAASQISHSERKQQAVGKILKERKDAIDSVHSRLFESLNKWNVSRMPRTIKSI